MIVADAAGKIDRAWCRIAMATVTEATITLIEVAIGIMSIEIRNTVHPVIAGNHMAAISGIPILAEIMNIITRATGIPGMSGKGIRARIRTDSIKEDTIARMAIFSSDFATRWAVLVFSFPLEDKVSRAPAEVLSTL